METKYIELSEDLKKEEFKKISLRFLKETGLYATFRDYILNHTDKCGTEDWYKTCDIDSVFGRLSFTDFLASKNFKVRYMILCIFRFYIKEKYKDKFKLGREDFIKPNVSLIDGEVYPDILF